MGAYRDQEVRPCSDEAEPNEEVHSRPLTQAIVSDQPEKRARIPETHAEVNPETFAMMLESDGNLETYTELNAVALDLHEPDPQTMWSSDLERGHETAAI